MQYNIVTYCIPVGAILNMFMCNPYWFSIMTIMPNCIQQGHSNVNRDCRQPGLGLCSFERRTEPSKSRLRA